MNLLPIVAKGPQPGVDGDNVTPSVGEDSAALFGGLHGKYLTQGLQGLVFSSTTNASGLPFSSVSTTGISPLALYNPSNSRKYVSVIRWEIVITSPPVSPVIGAYIFLIVTSQFTSAASSSLVASSIISISRSNSGQPCQVAPPVVGTFYRPFVNHLTGAITTTPNQPQMFMEFDGMCILAPNTGLFLQQLNNDASNATPESKVIWEEFPYP